MRTQQDQSYGTALRRAMRPLVIALVAVIVILALVAIILWISPAPRP